VVYPKPVDLGSKNQVRVVYTYAEYSEEALRKSEDPILIGEPPGLSLGRISLLHLLVSNKELSSSRENWLYGLLNPAELVVYPELFSAFFSSRLTTALCETAYRYAVYGALFSRTKGVLARLPLQGGHVETLDREQKRAFHYNVSIVAEFLCGEAGLDYANRARAIIERGI
jgi:hypothetical protein